MEWTVVGHTQQKDYFRKMLKAGTFAHAFLLHGPQGVGKRMLAGDLAAALLSDGTMALANNPDFILLQPGVDKKTEKVTEIPVEAVRDMKVWAYQRPIYGNRKVVLIDDAEQMSDAAANTVLKVLEEPPSYLYFLLVSSRSGQLLDTIVSRCQDIAFRMLDDDEMKTVLHGKKLDADDRQLITAVAAGRPGTALRLVRDEMLPVVAKAIAGLEKMQTSGITERLLFAKTVADDDLIQDIVSWWLAWTHSQLATRPKLAVVANGLLDLYNAVSESKYNRRLAVEKFLLELPVSA
jgi:DNA polymerase-3 subunit delta'